jgi:hypothetical protein
MLWGLAGLLAVVILIMTGMRVYKKFRKDE